jgi:hypothetical protein
VTAFLAGLGLGLVLGACLGVVVVAFLVAGDGDQDGAIEHER